MVCVVVYALVLLTNFVTFLQPVMSIKRKCFDPAKSVDVGKMIS